MHGGERQITDGTVEYAAVRSNGLKPRANAGDPSFRRKSSCRGLTKSGSAMRECLSNPSVCHCTIVNESARNSPRSASRGSCQTPNRRPGRFRRTTARHSSTQCSVRM